MFNLKNKRILITGASRGLGCVLAKALAEEGARLVLMARNNEGLKKVRNACCKPKNHLVVPCDLTISEELVKGMGLAMGFFGTPDVVMHVAGGGLGMHNPLIGIDDFVQLFKLNLGIASEINRIIAPKMIKRHSGNLVHVASISSSEATGSVGYNTVKAALAAYVRSLGRELAGSGVVVTGILPGGFYAPGNSWERFKAKKPSILKRFIKERLPRGFLGKAEEIIPLLLFLCSDSASMMGGCLVPIDAGEGKAYLT